MMKIHFFCALMFYYIVLSNTRLVQRTTDKTKDSVEGIKDELSSKENIEGPEIVHFFKGKVRTPRQDESNQTKNAPKKHKVQTLAKTALVKKPIPKYHEMDNDEDYQPNQIKSRLPSKLAEPFDLEDEDFSLDDYDFDVNHDEFVGRGKPLEPRKEHKPTAEGNQSKSVHKTKRNLAVSKDKNSAAEKPLMKMAKKVIIKVAEDEYDEEIPINIRNVVQKTGPGNADETSSVGLRSSQYPRFIRYERSPGSIGNTDKLGENKLAMMFFSMFPQIPNIKQNEIKRVL